MSGYNRKHKLIEIKVLKGVSLEPEQIYPCGDILSQWSSSWFFKEVPLWVSNDDNKIIEVEKKIKILVYV